MVVCWTLTLSKIAGGISNAGAGLFNQWPPNLNGWFRLASSLYHKATIVGKDLAFTEHRARTKF